MRDESKILYQKGDYWVSNEGTKSYPNYHVWKQGLTHSEVDSAYKLLALACKRCRHLYEKSLK